MDECAYSAQRVNAILRNVSRCILVSDGSEELFRYFSTEFIFQHSQITQEVLAATQADHAESVSTVQIFNRTERVEKEKWRASWNGRGKSALADANYCEVKITEKMGNLHSVSTMLSY